MIVSGGVGVYGLDEGEIEALDAMRTVWPMNGMGWYGPSSEACNKPFPGVQCDRMKQHVISIQIQKVLLSGILPIEIGNLRWIKTFSIQSSPLIGEIPDVFYNWTKIENFALVATQIQGTLPPSICQPSLTNLHVNLNMISGTLPDCLGEMPLLENLDLQSNMLHGTLPASLGTSPSLKTLELSSNRLEGPLLPFFESPELGALQLRSNNFSGTLPASWGRMPLLRSIHLSNNQLVGTIPTEWGHFESLSTLDLRNNFLSGSLPSSIGSLSKLADLHLFYNMLSGTIPASIGDMKSITLLYLSNNRFSGTLPEELSRLKTQLKHFKIAGNNISGTIPEWINDMGILQHLDLSQNSLHGQIPPLDSMHGLRTIQLQDNQLEGSFPLLPTARLVEINFAKNRLSGFLPSISPSSSTLEYFNVSKNAFRGPFPQSFSQLASIKQIDVCDNLLNGTLSWAPLPKGAILDKLILCGNSFSSPLPTFDSVHMIDLSRNPNLKIRSLEIPWIFKYVVFVNISYTGAHGSLQGVFHFANLHQLKEIDLSGNHFSGPFPWSEVSPRFSMYLKYLSVRHNPHLLPTPDYNQTGLISTSGGAVRRSMQEQVDGYLGDGGDGNGKGESRTSCLILSFPSPSPSIFLYDERLLSFSGCQCDKGTWGSPGSCLECPSQTRGISCPGGHSIDIATNFYPYIIGDNLTGQVGSERCLYDPDWIPQSWNPCPSKSLSRSQILSSTDICANGDGRRCSHCTCPLDKNEPCFFHKSLRCFKCSPSTPAKATLLGILIPFLLVLCMVTVGIFTYKLSDEKKMVRDGWKMRLKMILSHGILKILISFVQFSLLLVHWDVSLNVGAIGVINSDPTGIGLQCAFRNLADPFLSFLLKSLLPFFIIIAAWCLVGIASVLSRYIIQRRNLMRKRRRRRIKNTNQSSQPKDPLISKDNDHYQDEQSQSESDFDYDDSESSYTPLVVNSDEMEEPKKGWTRSSWSLGTSMTLSVTSLFYFGFSVNVISMLIREKQVGTSNYFMLAHPFLSWNDPTSSLLRLVAGFFLIVVIAVPVINFFLLVRFRNQLQEDEVFSYISTLYRPFKTNRYWWDLVLTSRKFCIAAVLVGIDSDSAFKQWAVTITITAFLLLQVYLNPWKRNIENTFDILSSAVLLVTYLSTTHNDDFDQIDGRKLVMVGRIVAIGFVLFSALVLVISVLREKLERIEGDVSDSEARGMPLQGGSNGIASIEPTSGEIPKFTPSGIRLTSSTDSTSRIQGEESNLEGSGSW
jgi:Leucine-rich repeat (LRR) protein